MSYEFTKLSEVEFAEQPSTEANILIEDNGDIKKTLLANISGSGVGVETIDFTTGGYGFINEMELSKEAFLNNMTFHLILESGLNEFGDGLNFIHLSFPRVKDFSSVREQDGMQVYSVTTTIPVWDPSDEAFVSVKAGFDFIPDANPDVFPVTAIVTLYSTTGNIDFKACYATTV